MFPFSPNQGIYLGSRVCNEAKNGYTGTTDYCNVNTIMVQNCDKFFDELLLF